jgi:peptidoglycan/LPS O-acetylase OafA/YrhL
MNETPAHSDRIRYLDALRGLAILLVIFYHAFARWPDFFPYGSAYASPVFNKGWLGIALFFMISGFVILMTLERTSTLTDFLTRRWLRLFPAMLIATALLFATAHLLPERPRGIPAFGDIFPGLLFIEPDWLSWLTGLRVVALDGSFWTLFIEVKYYVLFGSCYFLFGGRRAIAVLFMLFIFGVVMFSIRKTGVRFVHELFIGADGLSLQHFGWFAAGSCMYLFRRGGEKVFLMGALAAGITSAVFVGETAGLLFSALLIFAFFLVAVLSHRVQQLLANPVLLYLGFISYPLYLIHENALVALIVKLHRYLPVLPGWLLPVAPAALLIVVAYGIARLEPVVKNILGRLVHR